MPMATRGNWWRLRAYPADDLSLLGRRPLVDRRKLRKPCRCT